MGGVCCCRFAPRLCHLLMSFLTPSNLTFLSVKISLASFFNSFKALLIWLTVTMLSLVGCTFPSSLCDERSERAAKRAREGLLVVRVGGALI